MASRDASGDRRAVAIAATACALKNRLMADVALTSTHTVPFNKPFVTGSELAYVQEAIENAHLAGNGPFTWRCADHLREELGCAAVLLTHSCTGALEMSALLAEVGPGDEVILPSFTFTTTATAFVMRGATPVFVDIVPDTLNIDPGLVAAAITERTRAIVAVHYAGVGCEMDALRQIAERHGLMLIEDAAQGLGSSWEGKPLGTIGALGTFSFHETKNVMSGEGGALLINDPALIERAEILQEKGTNRRAFYRGQVDKYSWVDLGSSFLPSELTAAFLWAQLEDAASITQRRLRIWDRYHEALEPLEQARRLRRPIVPAQTRHNAHMYYVLLGDGAARDGALEALDALGINALFHYVPLHSSPAGRRFGRTNGPLPVTDEISGRLLRLPLWVEMTDDDIDYVVDGLRLTVGA
jgi:dTDP-4-amino-4,6-dideoxygalactose transaminase